MQDVKKKTDETEVTRLTALLEAQERKLSALRKEIQELRIKPRITATEIRADHKTFEDMLGAVLSVDQCRLLHRFVSEKEPWLNDATPWYTEGAKSWLSANVRKSDRVIEYGGGRSTIWWCQHTERASVVEASPEWTFWLLLYLFDRPEALKNLRMHFVPAEWNPNFKNLSKRYWKKNRAALNEADVYRMESDLSDPRRLEGHNVLVLDGAIRHAVMVRFGMLNVLEKFEIIVIDNTEARRNSFIADHYFKDLPFTRLDFFAGPYDDIPEHQAGRHITSIYVREDRLKCEIPIKLGRPYKLTDEERDKHQAAGQIGDEDLLKYIRSQERYVNEFFE